MGTKKTIRKILFIGLWLAIGAGMVTLLAAAMRSEKNESCKDYAIIIKGSGKSLFLDEKDVAKLLAKSSNGKIEGQARSAFDLRKMEQALENNTWIKDAELYFDNKDVLRVTITERQPMARIFTNAGKTFYIDEEERQIPLSEKTIADLPVFTGFPDKKNFTTADSTLLHNVRLIAAFIKQSPFWLAQVSQVDITAERQFEMIPLVGNHVVKLGDGENIEEKFRRLYVFYKEVLSKTGFNKYRTIDVQYKGQVVGTKGYVTKVDSVQLRRNIEKLLQQAREMNYDTLATGQRMAADPVLSAETNGNADTDSNEPLSSISAPVNPTTVKPREDATPVKIGLPKKPATTVKQTGKQPVKPAVKKPVIKLLPKATMPKQNDGQDYIGGQ